MRQEADVTPLNVPDHGPLRRRRGRSRLVAVLAVAIVGVVALPAASSPASAAPPATATASTSPSHGGEAADPDIASRPLAREILPGTPPSPSDRAAERPTLQPTIVGGSAAPDGAYPWMTALTLNPDNVFAGLNCGGSVVARRWVVTAAHCVADQGPFDYQAIIGLTTLPAAAAPPANTYLPARVVADSRYEPDTFAHDLAVIEVTADVNAEPVAVPFATDAASWAAGATATVVGWGDTAEGGDPSPQLLRATMPVISDPECQSANPSFQSALMLCAGLLHVGGVDTCQGDSGGPLLVTGPSGPLLAGVTSFGIGCAEPENPGIYTEVASERDFLADVIFPDAPTLLTATVTTPGSALVTFAPGPADHGVDVTSYTVMATPGGLTKTVPAGATSATLTGLAENTSYTVTVFANSAFGTSDASNSASISTATALGTYTGVTPQRLLDTRQSAPVGPGSAVAVSVIGRAGVPATDVAAVTLNLTATDPSAPGYLTAYPCGSSPPLASNLNYATGQTVANAVTVAVGPGGDVCVFSLAASHVVVDVTGWYSDAGGPIAARFAAVAPARLIDTRTSTKVAAGTTVPVPVAGRGGLPAGQVVAATLNVTATDADAPGFLTVFPCAAGPPLASSVNYAGAAPVANAVTVAIGQAGSVCVFAFSTVHVIIDVTGFFTNSVALPAGRLVPIEPVRVMDTRSGLNGTRLRAGAVQSLPIESVLDQRSGTHTDVSAVVVNVTAVNPAAPGFVIAFPCGGSPPLASNLNYGAGAIVANQVTVGTGAARDVCFTSFADTDLVVDVTGYYGPLAL